MTVDVGLIYIRSHYQVPAKLGGKIRFDWPEGKSRQGNIVGSECQQYLVVDFGRDGGLQLLHPTWQVTYLDSEVAR